MARKKGKSADPEKKAKLKAEKALKVQVKDQKKAKKKKNQLLDDVGEEDIEAIVAQLEKQQSEKTKITVKADVNPPSPRLNLQMVPHPTNTNELIFFGGEFYNGKAVKMFDEVHRYNTDKKKWSMVKSKNCPTRRSAHQMASVTPNQVWLFGGEFTSPSESQFYHFNDTWMFDLSDNSWTKTDCKGPSARSGHRMVSIGKHVVLFGGFYDNGQDPKYFNDTWILDTEKTEWTKIKTPEHNTPHPRSGFGMFHPPQSSKIMIFGGYSRVVEKSKKAVSKVHNDIWTLDLNIENIQLSRWEKTKKAGLFVPTPRTGFGMAVHKNRAIVLGGAVDDDKDEETMNSIYLNDMYSFQIDNRRWFPLTIKKKKAKKSRRVKKAGDASMDVEEEETETLAIDDWDGWAEEMEKRLEDGEEMDTIIEDHEKRQAALRLSLKAEAAAEKATAEMLAEDSTPTSEKDIADQVKQMQVEDSDLPEAPCERASPSVVIVSNMLYMFGGVYEQGTHEVILNDFWSLDLSKMDGWNLLEASDKPLWQESESESESNDEEDEDDDDEYVDVDDEEEALKLKELKKKERLRTRDRLREAVLAEEAEITPKPHEIVASFFSRTQNYWVARVIENSDGEPKSQKEMRRLGFGLARVRYDELRPLISELEEIEADILEMQKVDDVSKSRRRR